MSTHADMQQVPGATPQPDWRASMPVDTTSIVRRGMLWVGLTLAIFTIWGLLFPLASSVVSIGTVTPTGRPKLVQHPTGGVVLEILAKDGDYLEKGALIARVEPALAKAELANLLARLSLLEAQESRLRSMKSGTSDFLQPGAIQMAELRGTNHGSMKVALDLSADLGNVLREQEEEFFASRDRLSNELSALAQQLEGIIRDKESLEQQLQQQDRRLEIARQQVSKMKPLAEAGYIAKVSLWEAQSQLADSERIASQLKGEIARRKANIGETTDRISVLRSASKEEISKERSSILTELASINQQIRAAELSVEYSEMRAPVSGTLAKLQTSTIGGVIEAGAAIAEIIPDNAKLEIETRILPQNIGDVRIGQEAELMITSFNRRLSDPIVGSVTYVAANSSMDERTGETYFVVRIEPHITPALKQAPQKLMAGMQSDVYIKTGSRSFFSWLMAPIMDSLRRAFNEA